MTQDKKGVSAMKLHRHLGISYNAAWRIRHKLMQVMMSATASTRSAGGSSSTTPISVASEVGASAVAARPQDALCRRRPDQRAGTPVAHEAHRRRGLPSHRNRRLGAAPPRYRHSGRLRWVGLLSWRHRGGLRSSAGGGGQRESRCRAPRVSMGEYDSRQHQERLGVAPTMRFVPSMLSDISRSSSIVSIVASTCLTSSRDLSTWRSGRRRCRNGYSSYA